MKVYRTALFLLLILSLQVSGQNARHIQQLSNLLNNWETITSITPNENYLYLNTNNSGIQVVHIGDEFDLEDCHCESVPDRHCSAPAFFGDLMYISRYDNTIQLYDISDREYPEWIWGFDTPCLISSIVISNEHLYACSRDSGLYVYSMLDPEDISLVGQYTGKIHLSSFNVSGDYAYLTPNGNGILVLDLSDPENPEELCWHNRDNLQRIRSITIDNNLACISQQIYQNGEYCEAFRILHLPSPEQIRYISLTELPSIGRDIHIDQGYAYISCEGDYNDDTGGLVIFDISDPYQPQQIAQIAGRLHPNTIERSGDALFINNLEFTGKNRGLYAIDVSDPENAVLADSITYDDFVKDVHINNDYAYVGMSYGGLTVLDISDPADPEITGRVEENGGFDLIDSYDHFIVGGSQRGFNIIDVEDPYNPRSCSFDQFGLFSTLHSMQLTDNLAFFLLDSSILYNVNIIIIDISSPDQPARVADYSYQGFAKEMFLYDNVAYVFFREPVLHFMDISDPANFIDVGYFESENGDWMQTIYVDEGILYAGCGSRLLMIDVADLFDVHDLGYFDMGARIEDIYVSDRIAFIANEAAGLRVLDVSIPDDVMELGYYNTSGLANNLAVQGNIAYVADITNLGIYDFSEALSISEDLLLPKRFEILAAYPNPFNARLNLSINLPAAGDMQVTIHDLTGRQIDIINRRISSPGFQRISFNALDYASGTYVVKLCSNGRAGTRKIVCLK